MTEPALSIRGLKVTFGVAGRAISAVRGVDLDIFPREVLGLVGESGSGKSVTSLAVTGLLDPAASVTGSIRVGGAEVIGAAREDLRRMRGQEVGMIFQDPATTLNPVLQVGRQVTEGQVAHGKLTSRAAPARAVELLREVDIPDPVARAVQYPHQFSGGMRQRVVIAMAMAGRPRLIVADEPTTALDVTVQAQVLAVLARRRVETGAAVLLITHDLGVVAEVADRVAVMYGGRIVETGAVADIFARPRHPYTAGLLASVPRLDGGADRLVPIPGQPPNPADLPGGCSFHPRCAIARPRCAEDDPALREVGPGQAAACHYPLALPPSRAEGRGGGQAPARPSDLPTASIPTPALPAREMKLLEVDGLEVGFPIKGGLLRRRTGNVRAVAGVNLTVAAGETLGLVGESGCGKTTTGRAIMGLVPITDGQIRFAGQQIAGLGRDAMRAVRRHVQYVFQDPFASLNPSLTVGEAVAEPLRIHKAYDTMGGAKHVAGLFGQVGLSPRVMNRYPREFSGGQKQRIGIARALALQPRLLILDEPVAALDVSIQAQIVNLLQDLQRELGLAYLFIAHDLSVVRHISDRVAVMYLGRIVEESTAAALFAAPTHPYTQALLSAVPVADPARRGGAGRIVLEGEVPNPARPPSGCVFHPRCVRATARCAVEMPTFAPYPGLPTSVACHHAGPPA